MGSDTDLLITEPLLGLAVKPNHGCQHRDARSLHMLFPANANSFSAISSVQPACQYVSNILLSGLSVNWRQSYILTLRTMSVLKPQS